MKKLISKHQEGGSVGEQLIDAGKYMVPVYGTYLSVKDAIDNPSWQNWGLAGLSALGDVATIAGGSGLIVKGMSAASKGAKYAKAARASEKEAEAMIKYAERLAPISGKYRTYTEIPSAVTGKTILKPTDPVKGLKPEQTQAVQRAINGIYADAEGTLRRAASQEMFADMYRQEAINHMKQAGLVAAGGTSVKGGKSIQKAAQSDKQKHTTNNQRQNYVQKDTTKPWWNPFNK